MTILSDFDAVCTGELVSATLKVTNVVPALVGVPVIAPVDGFRLRPAGSVPVCDQL